MSEQKWEEHELRELFTVHRDSVVPAASPDVDFHHHSLPAWDEYGGPIVEKGAAIESNKTEVTEPCVLVSKLNPRKPRVSVVESLDPNARHCASTEFVCFRPKTQQSLRYWGYYFSGAKFSHDLERHAIGSTNSHTRANPRDPLGWTISVPPVCEQELIAQILDTLDTQIRQTEALIAKLERIKQGLLTDLLTRGIDENGQLRPPPEEAPHLYKDSPLGWIPREWEVSEMAGLLSEKEPAMRSGPFGSSLLKSELVESGIPLLGIDNVHVEEFRSEYTRFVTYEKFLELARYAVRPEDIMITIMGTVGRCCLVPDDIGLALSSKHTWTITLDPNLYLPRLAMLQINYAPWVIRHLARDEQGGIMSAIRSETLRSVRLPVPPIGEQQLIDQRLHAISQRIKDERKVVSELYLLKYGLMDDLLTGRIRVTPLLETGPPNSLSMEAADGL